MRSRNSNECEDLHVVPLVDDSYTTPSCAREETPSAHRETTNTTTERSISLDPLTSDI